MSPGRKDRMSRMNRRAFMTLLDRAVGTAPEHDYGRASRYDG